ncbi:rod shape-determining protein [Kribbella sp. NPDC000426]|uniref:rod shape-determining protein n=1 Tax=Kribbella sp. NPDC000426 TaxID=3154255 RepID=UPI003324EB68
MNGLRKVAGIRPGPRPWSRLRTGLALDLGSVRTRAWMPDHGLVVDAPTVTISAAGACHPLSRGRITDVPGTARMLDRLLLDNGVVAPEPELVVMTVPVLCSAADRDTALAAVEVLRPRTIITLDSVKAAAIGAKADVVESLLVIDLGAHLTELAVLSNGTMIEARRCPVGIADLELSITIDNLIERIRGMVTDLLGDACGPQVVDALERGPLLAGGGAMVPAITYQLSKQLSCFVQPAPAAYTVALRGAAAVALAANRHPGAY